MGKRKVEVSQWFRLLSPIEEDDKRALCEAYIALCTIHKEMWSIVEDTGNEFEEFRRVEEAFYSLEKFLEQDLGVDCLKLQDEA